MTLGDLLRKYFEQRRKICEQKARYLDLSTDNFDYYSDHDPDERVLNLSNVQYFSNNLEPKSERPKGGKSSQLGKSARTVTTSSITITLPDGTRQRETVVRDSDGNEEKHITYRKNGKNVKRIIRKDPSGVEHIEEMESDAQPDSGYDFWFNKFFKPEEDTPNDDGPAVFGNMFDMDKTIREMMKIADMPDGFTEQEKKKNSGKQNGFSNEMFPREFSKFLDSDIQNEAHRFLQNFGNTDFDLKNRENNVQNIIKKFLAPPESPSMFEQFAEDALIEIPDEKTPLDKFIEPDEERLSKLKPKWQKTGDLIKKLDQYLMGKSELELANDVYSDIENPEEVDISLPVPFHNPRLNDGHQNDFIDVFRKAFGGGLNGSNMTATFIDNGKKRVESIKTNAKGETEKNVNYQIGNKSYTVTIITDKTGKEIKREKSLNFPESELSQFKNQWSRVFHSDFSD